MPAIRIIDFDTWQPGYGGSVVRVYLAGTTTLASIYSNEGLTTALSNPQTLSSLVQEGVTYGKFAQPVYVGAAFYLDIDQTDQTGIVRPPLTTLDALDASKATAQAAGGSQDIELEDIVARVVHVKDYGEFKAVGEAGASAATNTTTLTAAIGAANGNGGGIVMVPPGTFAFTQITVSANVLLMGQGRKVTILQSQTGANVVTISGDRGGLARIGVDGVNLVASSVGVFAKAVDEIVFNDVEIKRFVTGLHFKGGRRGQWKDLYVSACTTGAKLHGDLNAGGGSDGDEFRDNEWTGGVVDLCTSIGVELSYEDKRCRHNTIRDVGFESNTGKAIRVNGAQNTKFSGCWFVLNTTTAEVLDDTLASVTDNTVIGLCFEDCAIEDGAFTLNDTCQDTIFERCEIVDVDFTLTAVDNSVIVKDCTEDSAVTISGDGTKFTRWTTADHGASAGTTTGATATKAWSIALEPGQRVYLEAKVIGNSRNSDASGEYHISVSARRPPSTLPYDTQTANFTLGSVLTGTTSAATARIVADSDSGATGTLSLRDIVGVFQDNEIITDAATGSATVNGTLSAVNAALLGSVTAIRAAREDVAGWDATFVANGPEIELQVTGAASTTIEWLCDVGATQT
mgnify:CR=1 FL=1